MIKYIDGDLVKEAELFDVIAHCCNCFCTMGAGIAPQIKNKFPDAYVADFTPAMTMTDGTDFSVLINGK